MRRTSRTSRVTEIVGGALGLALGLGALATPAVARAQEPKAPAPASADAKEKSRAAFKRGVAQLKAQDWTGARASFELAWSLYQHPSILLNLGIARLKTGDPVLAEQDLTRFLSDDSGSSPEEVAGAREALADARSKVGTLRVLVTPPSARVTIDGKPVELVRPTDGSEGVFAETRERAGKHTVSASAAGFAAEQRDVDLPGKGEIDVKIALPHAAGATGPESGGGGATSTRTILGISAGGLAGVALVTGIVTGLRAKSLSDDYTTTTSTRYGHADIRSEGITFRTVTDVAFGVAILSGAAAAILLVTDIGSASVTSATARTQRLPVIRW
jgi:hypothetical protein